jgi:hypothetical protein
MAALEWPQGVGLSRFAMQPVAQTRTSAPGLDGRQQFVTTENRVWRGSVSVAAFDVDQLGAWLGFAADLGGRGGVFALPVPDPLRIDPVDDGGPGFLLSAGYTQAQIDAGQVAFSGGELFAGGEGFALAAFADPVAGQLADIGAAALQLSGILAQMVRVGSVFSINGYLHRVTAADGGALRFAPPLRAAVAAGAVVNMIAPQIFVRLVDDAGAPQSLDLGGYMAGFDLQLVEVFAR